MDNRTKVTPTTPLPDFLPIDCNVAIPLSQFPTIALDQLITVKAKVIHIYPPQQQVSNKGQHYTMQDVIIADSTNSVKLTLWEDFVGTMEKEQSYLIKNVKVRRFNGQRYLNTPAREGCMLQEVEPLEGPLADVNIPQLLTTIDVEAEIIGVNNFLNSFTCCGCPSSFTPEGDAIVYNCKKCGIANKLSKCQKTLSVRLLLETASVPPRKVYVTVKNYQAIKLAQLAQIDPKTCSKKDFVTALLSLPVLKLTYDGQTKKVSDISLGSTTSGLATSMTDNGLA